MQYRYIVVELRDGGSWHLYGDKDRPRDKPYPSDALGVLPKLLADGWVPVRETTVGAANMGMIRNEIQVGVGQAVPDAGKMVVRLSLTYGNCLPASRRRVL